MVNPDKTPNYELLAPDQKRALDKQINIMIGEKYDFINYNGLRKTTFKEISKNGNPFDDKVIVIDEVHNLISRIVNKIKQSKSKREDSVAFQLYKNLMEAQNTKIVLLSGTPMINYPNEIGILFNILRGAIKTYIIPLNISKATDKIDKEKIRDYFKKSKHADYIDYDFNSKQLTITKNPFGFINHYKSDAYKGVIIDKEGEIDEKQFLQTVRDILKTNKISFDARSIKKFAFKALPDTLEEFTGKFLDGVNIKNINLLMRRIIGLTSFYKSAQEQLLPSYNEDTDLIEEMIDMSDFQFGVYLKARAVERKQESARAKKQKKMAGNELYEEIASTYRIFSRLFCNFVFPAEIERPLPKENDNVETAINKNLGEDIVDNAAPEELIETADTGAMPDDVTEIQSTKTKETDANYEKRIQLALIELQKGNSKFLSSEGLQILSPKFLKLTQNILDETHQGKHLIYSQFRTLEGIGIIKLILEFNGFVQFKLKRDSDGDMVLDVPEGVSGAPMFALYTGTETTEEKEITRNAFNDDRHLLSQKLRSQLDSLQPSNIFGQLIKVFMITASGAEGISLKNVRYVHITEPYWHPVRREQVIGRAKRICSHNSLPPELRTVQVHLYIMKFSEEQLSNSKSDAIELKLKDKSKDGKSVFTTDQTLHEISNIKQNISNQLLVAIKQSAVDCEYHNNDNLICYKFHNPSNERFTYVPDIDKEEKDEARELNVKEAVIKPKKFKMPGTKDNYILDQNSNLIYDFESFERYNKAKGKVNLPDPIGQMKKVKVGEEGKEKLHLIGFNKFL